MPPRGAAARAEQHATLAGIRHRMLLDDELAELIEAASQEPPAQLDGSEASLLVRRARRDAEKARRVPAELQMEMARAASLGESMWAQSRPTSDFALVQPHLERLVELARRYAECFEAEHPYDPLLDDYEPEARTADVRSAFEELRDGLVPLVARAADLDRPAADPLRGDFDEARQRGLAARLVGCFPLAAGSWRIDETIHPFEASIGLGDVRITTHYDRGNLGACIWTTLHEAGHALYDSGVDPGLARSPLGDVASYAFHESQSRLWENWVGRSRAFISWLRIVLRELYPEPFADTDLDALYLAANRVEPSLIRIEADELTYNLHIIVRFELELALFERRLEVRDLPEAWNALMESYLGLRVPDDSHGVMQDVHWYAGAFGYFPTYAMGNMIAAELWELARAELPALEADLERGDFASLGAWLRERVHCHGALYLPDELLARITGGAISSAHLLRHLARKLDSLEAS